MPAAPQAAKGPPVNPIQAQKIASGGQGKGNAISELQAKLAKSGGLGFGGSGNQKSYIEQKTKGKAMPPKNEFKWLCHIDPDSGDVFYENIASGDTTWDRPNEPIKPHWLAHLDPDSGELYFENIDSGETSWEKPEEFSDPEEKWQARKEHSGNYVYENLETGKTSYECPPCFQEKVPEQEWVRHFDPNSGEYYYENLRTGLTTWDAPQGIQF